MKFSIKKGIRFLTDSDYRFLLGAVSGKYKDMPDEEYLKRWYSGKMQRELNLNPPTTFNEKLQWLKLHDHNPVYTIMADKYEVKKYVADRIGEDFVVPNYGVWDSFDQIDFDSLPRQFVLKCTHDSGGIAICKDKSIFDYNAAKESLEKSLKRNYYYQGRQWCYKDIKPRILAEQFLEDGKTGELRDYKFFCFDGVVKAMFIATNRQSKEPTAFDFFDADFNHLDIKQGHPNAPVVPQKPDNYEKMKKLAEELSQNMIHVRVDFYEVNGKIYFGEFTFYHFDGAVPFIPEKWDRIFGDWMQLPKYSS